MTKTSLSFSIIRWYETPEEARLAGQAAQLIFGGTDESYRLSDTSYKTIPLRSPVRDNASIVTGSQEAKAVARTVATSLTKMHPDIQVSDSFKVGFTFVEEHVNATEGKIIKREEKPDYKAFLEELVAAGIEENVARDSVEKAVSLYYANQTKRLLQP